MSSGQALLWRAYQQGVTIQLSGHGGLRLSPANETAQALTRAVRKHKSELMALVADLEQTGAQNDPLILEALALFKARIAEATRKTPAAEQACFNLVA